MTKQILSGTGAPVKGEVSEITSGADFFRDLEKRGPFFVCVDGKVIGAVDTSTDSGRREYRRLYKKRGCRFVPCSYQQAAQYFAAEVKTAAGEQGELF